MPTFLKDAYRYVYRGEVTEIYFKILQQIPSTFLAQLSRLDADSGYCLSVKCAALRLGKNMRTCCWKHEPII